MSPCLQVLNLKFITEFGEVIILLYFFNLNVSKMECIVADVENIRFDIEVALDEQYGALPLPFPGMDSMQFNF